LPGTFTQDKFGTLTTIVGTLPNLIVVGSQATLGGQLVTALATEFAPNDTDRFDILTASSVSGTFASESKNGFVSLIAPTKVTLARHRSPPISPFRTLSSSRPVVLNWRRARVIQSNSRSAT